MATVPYLQKSTPRWLVGLTLVVMLTVPFLFPVLILVATPLDTAAGRAALAASLGVVSPFGRDALTAGILMVIAFLFLNFGAIFSGICVWWERRIAGRIQSRIGPNRQGLGGFLVWIADAVKFLLKEDLVPAEADSLLFRIAPYFVLTGFALTFVVLPFGHSVAMTNLNVGVFYITSVTALVVVGILISGWSSNSKWALFGGMRSAAQVVSYEIPAGIAVFIPVIMAGSLSLQEIIRQQGAAPWDWFIFRNPAATVAFFVLFISQLAEANRTPFDLPEAESELVAGYLSEYSGFRFALFFMAEFGNIWVMSALATTLFLGGWQVPFWSAADIDALHGAAVLPPAAWWGLQLASMAVFAVKTLAVGNVVIWLRWTLPRIRVDQMMTLSWKYLVPIGFACLVFTLFWELGVAALPRLELFTGVVLSLGALLTIAAFLRRVFQNVADVRGDTIDLSNW